MPRVTHVKSARKANPVAAVGQQYYWWKFRFGGKHYSLTRPKQSQLTQSAYFGGLFALQEWVAEQEPPTNEDDFEMLRDECTSQLEEIRDQCEESRENMPEGLQDSPTGELLQERYDACDSALNDLEGMEFPEGWGDYREWQDAHDEWENGEPNEDMFLADNDQTAAEQFETAHDEWENDEPDEVDEPDEFEMSEFTDAIDQCHV